MDTSRLQLDVPREILSKIDDWRENQSDRPSQAEAALRLIESKVSELEGDMRLPFSNGERMILGILCDLANHFAVDKNIDVCFVENALYNGHEWALEWKYPGVFERSASDATVHEVVGLLAMWRVIEYSYGKLSEEERGELESEGVSDHDVRFRGFDGNEESEHLSVASFLIEELDRFDEFKDRDLNAHAPVLWKYRRMKDAFDDCWKNGHPRRRFGLDSGQIVTICKPYLLEK